jgi:hypothetical protein
MHNIHKIKFNAAICIFISVLAVQPALSQEYIQKKDSLLLMQQVLLPEVDDTKYEEEIEINALPQLIIISVKEAYPEHEIVRVYQARDGSYKIRLQSGEVKVITYYNLAGRLLKIENGEDKW